MISGGKSPRDSEIPTEGDAVVARQFTSQLIRSLRDDEPFDAEAVLEAHPSLLRFKSAVIDLAYEEFCRRRDAGESVHRESFARRFPDYRHSLIRLLEVHSVFDGDDDLLKNVKICWPEPGQTFLGFELREELGQGGFSRVFAAIQPEVHGRRVVVKVCVHGAYEVEALANLQHDHIVPVFSAPSDEEKSLTAICMPYLGRVTLCDVLDHAYGRKQRRPSSGRTIIETLEKLNLSPRQLNGRPESAAAEALERKSFVDAVAGIGMQLADALDYTHLRGLCHGDIKPSNVLLTAEGKAMLFDFNLAIMGGDQQRVGGTLPYMAPEQIRVMLDGDGPGPKIDARSDLFSLGVMLYQLLTGELPFGPLPQPDEDRRHRVAEELLLRQRSGPEPLQQKNPHVDKKLAWIIERLLAYEPAARFQSARALLQALRKRKSGGVLARLRITRRQALVGVGALATAGLAFSAVFAMWPESLVERSRRAFDDGDYKQVITLLESAPAEQLDNGLRKLLARSYMLRAEKYQDFQDYKRARDLFEVVRGSPASNEAVEACLAVCRMHAARGTITSYEQRHNDVKLLRSAHAKWKTNPEVKVDLAYCLLRTNISSKHDGDEWKEAKQLLHEVIDAKGVSNNTLAIAHFNLATIERSEALNPPRLPDFRYFDEARRLGVESKEFYVLGAKLHAAAYLAETDEEKKQEHVDAGLRLFSRAALLGATKPDLEFVVHVLDKQKKNFNVQRQFGQVPDAAPLILTGRLVDPLGGDNRLLDLPER